MQLRAAVAFDVAVHSQPKETLQPYKIEELQLTAAEAFDVAVHSHPKETLQPYKIEELQLRAAVAFDVTISVTILAIVVAHALMGLGN